MNEETKISSITSRLTSMGYYDNKGNLTWIGFQAAIINTAADGQKEGQSEIEALNDLSDSLFYAVDYRCKSNIAEYRNAIYAFAKGVLIEESTDNLLKMVNSILHILSKHELAFKSLLIDGIKSDFLAKVTPQIEKERKRLRTLISEHSEMYSIASKNYLSDWDYICDMLEYIKLFRHSKINSQPLFIACTFFIMGNITAKREERARRKKAAVKAEEVTA